MASSTKAPAKKAAKPAPKPARAEETFAMPQEVKDWIDRAQSIMSHQKSEIERLKTENKELKAYRRFAETRILRSDHE